MHAKEILELEESRYNVVKLEKLESNNDHHKRIDTERWRQERKMEEEIESNHNSLINNKNDDILNNNNELEEEEYEQEAATPNEPETEHLDASTPSREMCSKNSYHSTINKMQEEDNNDSKNVHLPIDNFSQSQQMLQEQNEEEEEEESLFELYEQYELAKVSCNVLSVFNQSPYISPHSLEYNSESHHVTDEGVNVNYDSCNSHSEQSKENNEFESKCSHIDATNTATPTETKTTVANINGSTSNQSQLHEMEQLLIEKLEWDNNNNNNNNDHMVDTTNAMSKEELQATKYIAEQSEQSICLSHPIVEFLSSIHLQGFAHSIIKEHQIYSLEELSNYMSAEVIARELLGERSSMHQRRELWKGVEQLRRTWEKEMLCKQQAAKKTLDKEIKHRKMAEIQARRKITKAQKLCNNQSNDNKESNAETDMVFTTASNIPISDNDTLDVICNRLLSSQKNEEVENVNMVQEEQQVRNVEETENANAKKANSKTRDVAAFMSEMKFKRCNRSRKSRLARNSKAQEQQQRCQRSRSGSTKCDNNAIENITENINDRINNNIRDNIGDTNNKYKDYANDIEQVEAVLEAAIAEALIYEKGTKSVTMKSENDRDVIVISDSDDDDDNHSDDNGDGCDFVKFEKEVSDTTHQFSHNINEESGTLLLCEGININEKNVLCQTNEEECEQQQEEEECHSESQKELMEQINALLLEYNNKHKTRNDSRTECLHGSEWCSLRAVLHPFHGNSGNEERPLVSLCNISNKDNEGNEGSIKCSSECAKISQENKETASRTHDYDENMKFACDKNSSGRGSSGSNMLELFGLEALEPTQLINEEENNTVVEEVQVCHTQNNYNNDDNIEEYEGSSFLELTQCISPINACEESHNDDASLPTSPLSQLLNLSYLQYSTNYPESSLHENWTELEHQQEQQQSKQKGDVCVDDVINAGMAHHVKCTANYVKNLKENAHGQSDQCNMKYSYYNEENEEHGEEELEELILHWAECPQVIRNMSTLELVNQFNQFVKSSSKIEIDKKLELSLEQREELEETLVLQSVQTAFARMVAPAMLHRSKRISQLSYKHLRTADYTKLVLQKMKCTELENNTHYNDESSRQDLDDVLLKQKICEEEYNEVGKCVFAALATETVEKLENTFNCNDINIINTNTNLNEANNYRQEKCELTSLEKILLLEPVQFDQVMRCVQQHEFSFVPQLKLRRLLDESGVSLSTAVDLSQRSDVPLQSSQPLEVHEQNEEQPEQQEELLHHNDANVNSQKVKKVKNTSSQVYFARRQHHSYYHPTTRVAGRRAIRTKRKRQ